MHTGRIGKRVLLDTNVWRYVIDSGTQGRLLRIARGGRWDVQIAPAVLYETLRIQDVALRDSLVRLMVDARFTRLMPEAYSESMQILAEVRRLRPGWLRGSPDLFYFERLRKDWARRMGGFWVRCARSPGREAAYISGMSGDVIERGRIQAQNARREMAASDWKRNPSFDKTLAAFPGPMKGWNGDPVEIWRVDSLTGFRESLWRTGDAYRDWLSPFMDLDSGLSTSTDWVKFWLYDVSADALSKQWLRAAHSFAQRFRKVSPGSICDTQLFTYLSDTDHFVTGDRALLQILEECRAYAPCPLPSGRLVEGGSSGMEAVFDFFECHPYSESPPPGVVRSAPRM